MAHDALVKFMWANVTRAKAMLRACLPPAIAGRCNWDSLRLEDGSLTDPSLKATHSDLLFRMTVGDEEALLYLVLEHECDENDADILQLQGYVQRVFEPRFRAPPGTWTLNPLEFSAVHPAVWRAWLHP